MAIRIQSGDILKAPVEAIVNPVNTVGVMGAGLARQIRDRYPDHYVAYREACRRGEVRIGRMFVHDRGEGARPRYIIGFPTKEDWRAPSKMEYIEAGLRDLARVIREHDIRRVAVPALGAGLGGLDWRAVRPLILRALSDVVADVWIFEPVLKPGPRHRSPDVRSPKNALNTREE